MDFCNQSIENNTIPKTYRSLSYQIHKLIKNDPSKKKLIYDSGEQVENNPFIIDGKDSNFTSVEFRKEFIDFIENKKDY